MGFFSFSGQPPNELLLQSFYHLPHKVQLEVHLYVLFSSGAHGASGINESVDVDTPMISQYQGHPMVALKSTLIFEASKEIGRAL